jgi:hypothetical protein
MELLGYYSNLNPLSVLDDESLTTKSRREKGGFIRPLEPVQGEFHQCLFDWHLRRGWDAHFHLEFGDRFPVGKVAVRDFFAFVYISPQNPLQNEPLEMQSKSAMIQQIYWKDSQIVIYTRHL